MYSIACVWSQSEELGRCGLTIIRLSVHSFRAVLTSIMCEYCHLPHAVTYSAVWAGMWGAAASWPAWHVLPSNHPSNSLAPQPGPRPKLADLQQLTMQHVEREGEHCTMALGGRCSSMAVVIELSILSGAGSTTIPALHEDNVEDCMSM